jgi:DNA-binding CsgD family transcriptional regulator
MELRRIDTRPDCSLPHRVLDSLIAHVGGAAFFDKVHDAVSEFMPSQRSVAFLYDREGLPVKLISAKAGSPPFTEDDSRKYRKHFFRFDILVHRMYAASAAQDGIGELSLAFAGRDELPNVDYRLAYVRANTTRRISVVQRLPEGLLTLHFYRGPGDADVTTDQMDTLCAMAPVLSALTRRHAELTGPSAGRSLDDCRSRLLALHAALAPRELDVCSLILKGLTVKEISRDLGIAESSIVCYRKRAYQRLQVASAKELMSACF